MTKQNQWLYQPRGLSRGVGPQEFLASRHLIALTFLCIFTRKHRSPSLTQAFPTRSISSGEWPAATASLAEMSGANALATPSHPEINEVLAHLAELAGSIAAQPERLALRRSDTEWHQNTLTSLQAVVRAGEWRPRVSCLLNVQN